MDQNTTNINELPIANNEMNDIKYNSKISYPENIVVFIKFYKI